MTFQNSKFTIRDDFALVCEELAAWARRTRDAGAFDPSENDADMTAAMICRELEQMMFWSLAGDQRDHLAGVAARLAHLKEKP